MRNMKHTAVALIAVAMIGSLAVKQAYDFKVSNKLAAILSGSSNSEMVMTDSKITVVSPEEADELFNEKYTQEEIEEIVANKSEPKDSYVMLTSGRLGVYEGPSDESNVIDSIEKCETVNIEESTEGWYKISYDGGKTGYVSEEYVTEDKSEAENAAMNFDNYKKAKVKTSGDNLNVRSNAQSDSAVLTQLSNGDNIVVDSTSNGYTKIYYGSDYNAGYVVSSAVECTGEWISKNDVTKAQSDAAERKAKAEKEAKAKADADAKAKSSANSKTTVAASDDDVASAPSSSKAQAIVNAAKKYLGVRYVWGGTSPSGFDCSGLVQYCCRQAGISVNRTSSAQFRNGKAVSKGDLQPGDLVFFSSGGSIHHVGIYIGNGQMIHAPQTGDVVKVSSINTAYRSRGYAGARRVA